LFFLQQFGKKLSNIWNIKLLELKKLKVHLFLSRSTETR